MPTGESKKPFDVHDSGVIRQRFRSLQTQAMQQGRGKQVRDAYRQIHQRLQTDPLEFGEPLYPLLHMRLRVFTVP